MLLRSEFLKSSRAEVSYDDTVDAMLDKTGLGWSVEKRPLFYADENGKRHETNKMAIVRSDTYEHLGSASENWKPVQNRDIVSFFKTFADEGGARICRLGNVREGRGIWALAEIDSTFNVGGGDEVKGFILLSSWHEPGRATKICTTPIRVWCDNALVRAYDESNAKYSQTHRYEFDFMQAREAVGFAKEEMNQFQIEARKLKTIEMSEYKTLRVLADEFTIDASEKRTASEIAKEMERDEEARPLIIKQLMESYHKAPGATPGNAWGVLNAVTHWCDHVAGHNANGHTRFDRAFFGNRAKSKNSVKSTLLAMAA
jgi:phage/plasmid-like protein (TIGR03299 family)